MIIVEFFYFFNNKYPNGKPFSYYNVRNIGEKIKEKGHLMDLQKGSSELHDVLVAFQ